MSIVLQAIAPLAEPASFGGLALVNVPVLAQFAEMPSWMANIIPLALNLLGAALILVLGWIVAGFVGSLVRKLLAQTTLDEQFAGFLAGGRGPAPRIDNIIAQVVVWIIRVLAVVAALNVLKLDTVSQPLTNFLNQIFGFLPRLGSAAALLGVAWILATIVKNLVIKSAQSFDIDGQMNSAAGDTPISPTETLGNALYWFVFLFFLPMVLGVLGLEGPLAPVQNLLNGLLQAVPKILTAAAIGFVGWMVAQVVKNVVTNLLAATGIDRMGGQVGLGGGTRLSGLAGTVVYVLILIPAVISALKALDISAISGPATTMLEQVFAAIPLVFTAGAILGFSYFVGKFLADLVTSLLAGFGFDNVLSWLGIQPAAAIPVSPDAGNKTPSEIGGLVVLVGTMLLAAVAAVDVLKMPALSALVSTVLAIAGQVLVGVAVFAVGLFLANFAAKLIQSSGVNQANTLSQVARIAILAFVGAMALERMGISTNIVNLAFGLLLGAVAVAIAIAFGLGGRDVAAENLRDWVKPFKR
jgi:Conserved TM helix